MPLRSKTFSIIMEQNIEGEIIGVIKRMEELMHSKSTEYKAPSIVYADYPDLDKYQIKSRDFKSGYLNDEEKVAGNLYSWIHQSYSVLYEIDEGKNEIILITKTIEKLGQRFATLIKIEKETAIKEVFALTVMLALFQLIWRYNNVNNLIMNNLKSKTELIFASTHNVHELNLNKVNIFNTFKRMFGNIIIKI